MQSSHPKIKRLTKKVTDLIVDKIDIVCSIYLS
jgi:hypothetical protein